VPVTVDTQGRVRASKEQRRLILVEFERSGVSAARFARQTGLKYSTLAGWLQRYRRTKPQGRARQVRLLEAVVEQAQKPGPQNQGVLVLQLPGGARVEINDVKQATLAAAVVRELAQSC
jgi:transposase-like protein